MKIQALTALLLLSVSPHYAHALTPCDLARDASLNVDFTGVRKVRIDLSLNDLVLTTSATGKRRMDVQHCASDAKRLANLSITAQRSGDTVIINSRPSSIKFNWFGPSEYGYSLIKLDIPTTAAVELSVGSGDAKVNNVANLDIKIGSGDAIVKNAGNVLADVGSGDLQIEGLRSLRLTVGSGDAAAHGVKGDVVASVGSGDIVLKDIGNLRGVSVGSGDLSATGVRGEVRIQSVGSGDAQLESVNGDVYVQSIGSGGIGVKGVQGVLHVIDKDDLESIERSGIKGGVRYTR